MPMCEGHADHAAPIMQDQCEILTQLQMIQQRLQVGDALPQRVLISRIIGLIRQTAADMVRHDGAIIVAQSKDELAVIERPCGITVQHHQWLAVAFVEVVVTETGKIQIMVCKRIQCSNRAGVSLTKESRSRYKENGGSPMGQFWVSFLNG